MKSTFLLAALTGLVIASAAPAASISKADAKAAETIKKNIEARYPTAKILSVQPSKYLGLYEVFTGDSVSYANATGDLLFVGSIMDTRTKTNLTVQRLTELNSIDFSTLPLDRAIKIVKGNGSRVLAVFTDPECPYCQELEKQLASVTDVTIYNFLFPVAELHPDAPARARALWCSPDRAVAWSDWMGKRKPPEWKTCDGDPVKEIADLAVKLRVNSTPTLFVASGKRLDGAASAPQLEEFLNGKPASEGKAATTVNPNEAAAGTPTAAR